MYCSAVQLICFQPTALVAQACKSMDSNCSMLVSSPSIRDYFSEAFQVVSHFPGKKAELSWTGREPASSDLPDWHPTH